MMLTVILTILSVTLYFVYYFCIKPLNYWKKNGIKQIEPVCLFGSMLKNTLGIEAFHEMVDEQYNKFKNERYFGLYQFTMPTLVLRDPELIKKINVQAFDHFEDHRILLSEKVDPLWGNDLMSLKGQRWREIRSILSPLFTISKLKATFVLVNDTAEKFVEFMVKKQQQADIIEVDYMDIFGRFCNDVIASVAFGIETNSMQDTKNELYMMGKEALDFNSFIPSMKMMLMMLSPKLCELLNIGFFSSKVRSFFYDLVDETIRVREEKSIQRPDLINSMLQARDGKRKQENESSTTQETHNGKRGPIQITNKDIASQAMMFFTGGFEPTKSNICFICYELAINPDIQERLRNEIKKTVDECEDGKLTYEALMKMKYMDMVISETFRKWPNSIVLDRECTKPYKIEPVDPQESPVQLDIGDLIWIPVYSLHYDEKYFPNPHKFDPERFNDENKRNIDPNTYLPFGDGPRNCIGKRFALLEIKTVLFHFLNNFEVTLTSKSPTPPLKLTKNPFQIMPVNGFWFGLKKLSK